MSEKCLLFGTCLVMPGELIWRLKIWGQSVKKIEEALTMKKMKDGERRDEDEEDERGSCTVWVGVRLRPSCLVCRGSKPGGLTIPGAWSCCSLSYSLGEVRYVELSVLVNVKSKPTIVSAGLRRTWPGTPGRAPLLPGVGCVCVCV